jgi:hypothetical protein
MKNLLKNVYYTWLEIRKMQTEYAYRTRGV